MFIIIIFEYTYNLISRIQSKYIFVNPNKHNYIPYNTQNTRLYTYRVATNGT